MYALVAHFGPVPALTTASAPARIGAPVMMRTQLLADHFTAVEQRAMKAFPATGSGDSRQIGEAHHSQVLVLPWRMNRATL